MHFAAGPWFEVMESGGEAIPLGRMWLSDGETSGGGTLMYRATLVERAPLEDA